MSNNNVFRTLVMDQDKENRFLTLLSANPYEETVYAETHYINEEGDHVMETVELGVHVNDMIKMRNFLDKIIKKIGPGED